MCHTLSLPPLPPLTRFRFFFSPSLLPPPDSKHEDGTQSDSENAIGEERRATAIEERSWGLWGGAGKIREGRANVPEGLFAEEESPARRRKSPNPKVPSGLVERRHQQPHRDDYSDRGTYTVALGNGEGDEEDAQKRIDKVERETFHWCNRHFFLLELPSDHKSPIPTWVCMHIQCCRCLEWMSKSLCVCPGWQVLTKDRGSPPSGLGQGTEENTDP